MCQNLPQPILGVTVRIDFRLFTLSERLRSYKTEICFCMNTLLIKRRKRAENERLKQKNVFLLRSRSKSGWNSHFCYVLVKPSQKSKENIFTFLRIVLNYREMSLN